MLTDKIHYRPGDLVMLTTPNGCNVVSEIDNTQNVAGSFVATGFGGFSVTDAITGATSVYTVSDNPLDTAVGGGQGGDGHTGGTKWSTLPQTLLNNGQSFVELFFWGPDDCSCLDWSTQPGGDGYSGQARYHENHSNTISLIKQLHAVGIAVGLYVNCYPCGPPGWNDFAVNHKDWCILDPFGNVTCPSPADLARWNDPTWTSSNWMPIRVDWSNLNAVDFAVQQIVNSINVYDWDVVRYDGFYDVPGDVSATIRNAVAVRTGIAELAICGGNFGKGGDYSNKAAIYCSDGGLYLQEAGQQGWQVGLAANAIDANWFTTGNGETSYAFPSHPMYGQFTTPNINRWLLRWSGFLWDRRAIVVSQSPPVGSYVTSRRGADGLRYDTLFFTQPGSYALPSTADVVTTPENTTYSSATATIKTFGIAIWKVDDRLPAGAISVVCDHGTTGYAAPIGADGRQYRPDLSTGTYPFLRFASVGPMSAGTYQAIFRLWYESSPVGAALRLRVEDNTAGQDISVMFLGRGCPQPLSTGWGYQDYKLSPFTLSQSTTLQASAWPLGTCGGALHLDSVSFVRIS